MYRAINNPKITGCLPKKPYLYNKIKPAMKNQKPKKEYMLASMIGPDSKIKKTPWIKRMIQEFIKEEAIKTIPKITKGKILGCKTNSHPLNSRIHPKMNTLVKAMDKLVNAMTNPTFFWRLF